MERLKSELLECMTVGCYPYSPAELVDVEIKENNIEVRTPSNINRALNLSIPEWLKIQGVIESKLNENILDKSVLQSLSTKISKLVPSHQFQDFSKLKNFLQDAIQEKKVITFEYHKRGKGSEIRNALPIFLFQDVGQYLAALCLKSNSLRSFRLDGIVNPIKTDTKLEYVQDDKSREEFLNKFKEFKTDKASDSENAELLVRKNAYFNLSRTIYLEKLELTGERNAEFIKVRTKIIEEKWFMELIKGFGNAIVVLSPLELRNKFLNDLDSIILPRIKE